MKPKGLAIDKDSPDFKKVLELTADSDLLASVDQGKRKFFAYLKNKLPLSLTPIQEEKQEKRCIDLLFKVSLLKENLFIIF